jgi:hypothetical protein
VSNQFSNREGLADRYFEQDLKGQREWYGRQASASRNWMQLLSLVVIGAGAATSFVQVFMPANWVPVRRTGARGRRSPASGSSGR